MRAAVALVVLLAACAPPSPNSALPSEPQTAEASTPLPSPSATPQTLVIDMIAEVVTNDLVVRSAPGVDPSSQILPGLLQPGDRLFVIEDGSCHLLRLVPRAADHRATARDTDWPAAGWVAAASREGEPWLAPLPIDCPQQGDLEVAELAAFHPLEALSCFGHRGLRVRAASVSVRSSRKRSTAPELHDRAQVAWHRRWVPVELRNDGGGECALPYFTPDSGGFPDVPAWLWLSGQFDHAVASSCFCIASLATRECLVPALDGAQVILLCRSHFAVNVLELHPPSSRDSRRIDLRTAVAEVGVGAGHQLFID